MSKLSPRKFLASMEIGERRYVETELEWYPQDMRKYNPATSRRSPELLGWQFSTHLLTAVSHRAAGDIRYLLCVERLA